MDITNTIGYYLRPNPTDTAEKAPYLPKLVPNGVANLNDIAKKIAESLSVSEERAKLIIRETFTESVAAALLGYTVDMGALRMKARIPGSMPCEDTPFDPEKNACVIELYADDELAGAFDALKPVKLTATQLANAIKVSNVMDVETEHFAEIHGTNEFMILGNGVTLDAPGESAKLADRKTGAETATAEVVSVSKGQRATCKFAAVEGGVSAGLYWLVVTTFGLIGETTPRVFRKPVTLTEDIPARPEPLWTSPDGLTVVDDITDADGVRGKVDLAKDEVLVRGRLGQLLDDSFVTLIPDEESSDSYFMSEFERVPGGIKMTVSPEKLHDLEPGTYADARCVLEYNDAEGVMQHGYVPMTLVVPFSLTAP